MVWVVKVLMAMYSHAARVDRRPALEPSPASRGQIVEGLGLEPGIAATVTVGAEVTVGGAIRAKTA